jgi:hypothetical protein
VTVGAAGSDVEVTRQNCAWQTNHDLVANLKVAGTTDDAANISATIGGLLTFGSDTNLAPANGLAVALWLWDEFKNLTDYDRAGDTESVRTFFFETDLDQFGHNAICGYIARKVNVVG